MQVLNRLKQVLAMLVASLFMLFCSIALLCLIPFDAVQDFIPHNKSK